MVGSLSYIKFFFTIMLIIIILKQYLIMWIILEKKGFKVFKYLLPVSEIILLIFIDELFLLPSVISFLLLIYKGRVFKDKIFQSYYFFEENHFILNKKSLFYIALMSPIIFFILHIINSFSINFAPYKDVVNLHTLKNSIDYLVLFGVTCIIAPLVEEFTFRALVYESWLKRILSKKIIALLVSSLIFAFSHFDINTVLYTFLTGIILGFIYDSFGYFSAVLLHMILNFFALVGMWNILSNYKFIIYIYTGFVLILIIFIKTNNMSKNKVKL